MSIVRTIFKSLLARQVAQHGSMAAVVVGLVCQLLGIPLAGEQISLLITGFSVVVYLVTQVRALWHPSTGPAVVQIPTGVKLLLAAFLVGELVAPRPALADVFVFTIAPPLTYTDNGGPDVLIPADWTVFTTIDCGPGSLPAGTSWGLYASVVSPSSTATADVPAGWYCSAHSAFDAKGNSLGAFGNVLRLPDASAPPPPPPPPPATSPSSSAQPGAPTLSVTRQ